MSLIIGISGGSGAGKTYLANYLKSFYGEKLSIISLDCYYKDHSDIPLEERGKLNYDCPDAYDSDLIAKQIKVLKSGNPIEIPTYDFATHTRANKTIHFVPSEIIIIEGIMVFQMKELQSLLDLKIFIDASSERRLARRILRDISERGRTAESVIKQYFDTVLPMHNLYIEPSKSTSDFIYDNNVEKGIDNVQMTKLCELISKNLANP